MATPAQISHLDVLVTLDPQDRAFFWFAVPPGEAELLERFSQKRREAVEGLLQQRYALSDTLRERILTHEKHQSWNCLLAQLCCGICLPSGLLIGTRAWDYDRDMGVLEKEVRAAVAQQLAAAFSAVEWTLQEHIDSEASWRDGKVLLSLYFN